MYIKVCQTKSNFQNEFIIIYNNQLVFLAGTPWMNLSLPFRLEESRPNIMTDMSGRLVLFSHFAETPGSQIIKGITNFGEFVSGGTQTGLFTTIHDVMGNGVGRFFHTSAFMDSRYIVECFGETITGFIKAAGRCKHISLYLNGLQIAQIVKPLSVRDNLDMYYIFLLDEFSRFAQIISFFTLYFDRREYGNNGIFSKQNRYQVEYSFNANDKYYQPAWIRSNFDLQRVAPDYIELDQINEKSKKNRVRNCILIVLAIIGGILAHYFIVSFLTTLIPPS